MEIQYHSEETGIISPNTVFDIVMDDGKRITIDSQKDLNRDTMLKSASFNKETNEVRLDFLGYDEPVCFTVYG